MLSRLPKVDSGTWKQTCGITYSSNGSLRENLEASHMGAMPGALYIGSNLEQWLY